MELLTSAQLVTILQRTLNFVDSRLVGHGERVAVVMYQILKTNPKYDRQEVSRLCLMGLLHDIGAYKTEEIDDLLRFESTGIWEHSAYGYLFLKQLSPMKDFALPILYHHVPYLNYSAVEPPLKDDDYAGLIYLADRMDTVMMQESEEFCRHWVLKNRGTLFSPYWVDALMEAQRGADLFGQLKSRAYEEMLAHMIADLELSPEEIRHYLSVIAYAIDFRSEFMVLHTVTTVSVSQVLGKKMNLSAEEQQLLYYGALLHDIGKVGCPVEILEKPGKLTPEEMEMMRHHVVLTREILTGYIDSEVLEIAARHHEKLNGGGYPQGLTGDQLTGPQRIAAVADIVSALIRKRSYKEAFDKQTTLGILERMRDNGELGPTVTKLVLDNFDEIVLAAERFGERVTNAYNSIRHNYISLLSHLPLS